MHRPVSDPAVKRTICKGCDTILIPGSTASVRVKSEFTHDLDKFGLFFMELQSLRLMGMLWCIRV
jgi:hypothetical protein